jgi:hypothetical protein
MSDTLITLHSLLRWLILAVAIFGTLRAALGLGGGLAYQRFDNAVGATYVGLLDLEALTGIVLLAAVLGTGRMPGLPHPLFTLTAVAVAHLARRAVQGREGAEKHRWQLIGTSLSLLLVVIGVQTLPTKVIPG